MYCELTIWLGFLEDSPLCIDVIHIGIRPFRDLFVPEVQRLLCPIDRLDRRENLFLFEGQWPPAWWAHWAGKYTLVAHVPKEEGLLVVRLTFRFVAAFKALPLA